MNEFIADIIEKKTVLEKNSIIVVRVGSDDLALPLGIQVIKELLGGFLLSGLRSCEVV